MTHTTTWSGWQETGWVPAIVAGVVDGVGKIGDVIAGGDAKRARAAKANAAALASQAEIERTRLEMARLQAGQQTTPTNGGGGFMGSLMAPSPILGLPWVVVVGAGAVGVWALVK